jgi:4-hydroxy-tetrahydrodipicolinate reductase
LIAAAAAGRMGSLVAQLAAKDPRFELAACLLHKNSGDSKPRGVPAVTLEDLGPHLEHADAAIDFSAPEASLDLAALAARSKTALVVGTTGFSKSQMSRLKGFSRRIPVFYAPNFSPGAFLLRRLAREAARTLAGFDVAISELHHAAKKDSPSGTALVLADSVAQAREGRRPPVVSQRAGDIVGEHVVLLAGPHERLEIIHRAHARSLFARGALDAALWLANRRTGFYGMEDMLG